MPGRRPYRRAKSPAAISIGKILRAKREELKISQEQFAERVSLSKNYIGNIERGEYEITISTLDQIARVLKTRASDIVRQAGY